MEIKKYKCSSKEHNEFDANCYCQKCDIYMCNKCEKYHSIMFSNHNSITLDKDIAQIFTGFCKIENHQNKLEYFCKNHNLLCCANCIARIKRKGNGQHIDCDVCNYEDIIDEKKRNLKNNIKILEDLSNSLQSSIDELKIIVEKLSKSKEEIKLYIQKIFTKIRNALNNREDELLLEVDNEYEKLYFNEEILTETEKLPNKIKISLEKGKLIDKEWDNNNEIKCLINDCINIENDIKTINIINEKIKECKSTNKEIKFNSGDDITILESIKSFGNINSKKENNQNNININVLDFNHQNIKYVKKISDYFGCNSTYVYDCITFFISRKEEYVLGHIDKEKKSIIFYDINNEREIKKINNAHDKGIYTIKYYNYNLYDIILTCSYNNDIKIWNYNETLNILTINNIFNNNYVFSSALLFDNNTFYIFCVGENNYINIYNSSGNLYKNIGNNDENRRYIEIFEINENKYIISGGTKGIKVFNYPSFSNYYCFRENNDTKYHNYAKIIKIKNIYNLIDVGDFNQIKIWDFYNKNLIKCITSNSNDGLGGFILINNIYLISGSRDNEIKVFDINNGIIVKKFNKHTSYVIGIKAIKDKNNNQYFLSYGNNGTINLWSLNE